MRDRLQVFKKFVQDLSTLSKCTERNVAAILTDSNLSQVYSIGVNGGAKGLADCMCVEKGKYGCVHAEINCLIKCQQYVEDMVMFVTLAPCKACAAAIVNAPSRIKTLYYMESWKESVGINMLLRAGTKVHKI